MKLMPSHTKAIAQEYPANFGINRGLNTESRLSFSLLKAENGFVLEVTRLENSTRDERYIRTLYIIDNKSDLGSEVSSYITLESLKL